MAANLCRKGLEYIQQELTRLDPEHTQVVDMQNHKGILRALEVCSTTGKLTLNSG